MLGGKNTSRYWESYGEELPCFETSRGKGVCAWVRITEMLRKVVTEAWLSKPSLFCRLVSVRGLGC